MINRRSRNFLVLVLAIFTVGCGQTPDELMNAARDALAAGEPRTADIHLRNFLQQDPDNAEARTMLAQVSIALGNYQRAEQAARRAIELGTDPLVLQLTLLQALAGQGMWAEVVQQDRTGPQLTGTERIEALRLVGSAHRGLGDLTEAERMLRTAVALDPESADSRVGLATVLIDARKMDEATRVLEPVLNRDPENVPAVYLRGLVEQGTGDLVAAEASFREVVRLTQEQPQRPEHIGALAALIDTLVARGELELAAESADALLAVNEEMPIARMQKANVDFALGNLDAAEQRLQELVAELPEFWPAYRLLGKIDAQQGQLGQAETNLLAAVNNNDNDVLSRLELAEVYIRQGEIEKARGLFAQPGAAPPSDSVFLAMAGGASAQAGRQDLAASFFEQTELSGASDIQELAAVAVVFIQAGEPERAIRMIESASFDDAESRLAARALVATVYLRSGDPAAAARIADELIEAEPDNVLPYNLRGMVALSEQDLATARQFFESALEVDPRHVGVLTNLARVAALEEDAPGIGRYLERIVAIDAGNMGALLGLAQLAVERGDFSAAESWADRIPDQAVRAATHARVSAAAGNFADAADAYSQAFLLRPSQELAIQSYTAALRAGRNNPEGHLLDWANDHPDDIQVNLLLGTAALGSGDSESAVQRFEAVVEADSANAVALNNLAWLYGENGDERAIEYGRRAHEAAPDNPAITDTLGWLLLESGDLAGATPLLEQAAEDQTDQPEIQYHWAVALARNGSVDDASLALERALAMQDTAFPSRDAALQLLQEIRAQSGQ